jgi:iron(III) transport system substrate-binding protein
MGTLIIPNCTVLINGGPNPEGGKKFIHYLLSAKAEQALAESEAAQIPVRPGVSVPAGVTGLDQLKPMQVDYAVLGTLLEELATGYLKDWVDRNSR